jgi:hypothetical protein
MMCVVGTKTEPNGLRKAKAYDLLADNIKGLERDQSRGFI